MNFRASQVLLLVLLASFAIALWKDEIHAEVTYCAFCCSPDCGGANGNATPSPSPTGAPSPSPSATPPPADLIVAPSGGDYTTIGAAYAAASCGQTIQVREGTYTLTSAAINLNKTCTSGAKLTVENYPDETPTVTCTDPETSFKRVEHNGAYNVWRGIEVTGCYDGIKVYTSHFEIYDSYVHHNMYQGILIAVTDSEITDVTIDGNNVEYNGYDSGNNITCAKEEWGGESPKHCHGIYISDFSCFGTDDITITGNTLANHGGRGIQWNGEGCETKMLNTLVQGNTFENNSHNIILWYNVENAVINDNDFIATGFPETDDTSHGHFTIMNSPGNTITNNTFYSDITTYEQLQMLDTGSDVGMTVDGNIWGYRNTSWKWDNSWRSDFDSNYTSVSSWDVNGCTSLYTSYPCTP